MNIVNFTTPKILLQNMSASTKLTLIQFMTHVLIKIPTKLSVKRKNMIYAELKLKMRQTLKKELIFASLGIHMMTNYQIDILV